MILVNGDYIGKYVERFESGNSGCLTFGQCGNDWGLSCGTNQRILRFGVAINFLKKYFSGVNLVDKLYFNNLSDREISYYPGESYCSSPDDVKAAWIYCVNLVGQETFEECEYSDIKENYYEVCKKELQGFLDVDANRAFQEMVFAGSIFNGAVAYANRIKNILVSYQNDEQFFDAVYNSLYKEYPWERWADAAHTSYIKNSERETLRPLLKKYAIVEEKEMSKKIMLDPGHFGSYYNQSPAVKKYYESNFTWDFTNILKSELEKRGFSVSLTRTNKDTDVGLVQRGNMSRGYDLFLSIHSNAVGNGVREDIDYPVAYVLMDDGSKTTAYDNISQELGQKLATCVKQTMRTKQDGIIQTRSIGYDRNGDGKVNAEDEYYGVLYGARQVKTPGIILEHSFHTNTRSTNWLLSKNNLNIMAAAEADVIAKYFCVSTNVNTTYVNTGIANATAKVEMNVRTTPNLNGQIVAVVGKGSVMEVLEVLENGWLKVVAPSTAAGYAYVSNINSAYFTLVNKNNAFMVKVDRTDLNIRDGAGTNYKVNSVIPKGIYTIVETKAGQGSAAGWGKLKSGAGWISLDFATRI